ncbi:CPBP family intramembrane metalloprotease [Sedimentibacter sp. zth1]|nr:CPBP family intramembrane metalloprotease [Sedimentibacter sp. zth1]
MNSAYTLTILQSILLCAGYFLCMLCYTILDMGVWRKITPNISVWLNIFTIILFNLVFFLLISNKVSYKLNILGGISFLKILLAMLCSILFYFALDKCLDPIFEHLFPVSEIKYQDTITRLKQSPVTSFMLVCIIAPVVEEILIRGFILTGLQNEYGNFIALVVSAILFALLHFNMVQTISAFICGLVLGLLYIKTDSIFCCIVTHSGYNIISYLKMILPLN